jgi:glucose-induced degradation protein 8
MYYLIHGLLLYSVCHHWLLLTQHFSDLNRLIMDYLVIEGFKSAAEEFSQEANLSAPVDFDSIESRMNIREALQRGDVENAIALVNDLNPEVSLIHCRPFMRLQRIIPFMHHS